MLCVFGMFIDSLICFILGYGITNSSTKTKKKVYKLLLYLFQFEHNSTDIKFIQSNSRLEVWFFHPHIVRIIIIIIISSYYIYVNHINDLWLKYYFSSQTLSFVKF